MNQALFSALEAGNRVVTATRRLRHELIKAYDREQAKQGNKVWPTARISTWDEWMLALWEHQSIHSERILLSTAQLRHLLSHIIELDLEASHSEAEASSQALWNIPATAKTALAAWQLCHQWQIPYTRLQDAPNEDHARFGRWASSLYARLSQHSWMSQSQLPEHFIREKLVPHEDVFLTGFDQLDSQQQAFIEYYRSRGAQLSELKYKTFDEVQLQRYCFETPFAEWQHIGAWARQHLEANNSVRLGVITPDIESVQAVARRALREQLVPAYFTDSTPDPFHFSSGERLLDIPAISNALLCLDLLDTIEYTKFEALFLSSYWGDKEEQRLRAELTIELRKKIAFQFDLFELVNSLKKYFNRQNPKPDGAEGLQEKLQSLQSIRQNNRQPQPISTWRDLFSRCLSILGWPGEQIDSDEYQALKAWERCLEDWVRMDLVTQPLSPKQALTSLKNHCRDTLFQAQPHSDLPVQIMGVLEAAGLEFDAAWLAGFDESSWPASPSVNPFIPVAVQIERGIPEATLSLKHALSKIKTAQLCGLAPEVNFSHSRIQEDIERSVSLIMPDIPLFPGRNFPEVFLLDDHLRASSPALLSRNDNSGKLYPGTIARGGTGLIQKQSVCPFSAYAQYRLNAGEDDRPEIGMDNMQRGNLLHQILENLWKELENSQELNKQVNKGTLKTLIRRHVDKQIAHFARDSGLGEGYQQAESNRLTRLISEWLKLENQRHPFKVAATERSIAYMAAGLQFNIKIDRIDETTTPGEEPVSSRLIMDYKSGRCSLKDWAHPRPAQPQVPLYYLAVENDLGPHTDAVAFAQVRQGESAFVGVGRVDNVLPGVSSLAALSGQNALKKDYPDWEDLMPGWRAHIETLAEEFQQGVATVDPRHNACNWCRFASLCRIHTRIRGEEEHDAD